MVKVQFSVISTGGDGSVIIECTEDEKAFLDRLVDSYDEQNPPYSVNTPDTVEAIHGN